MNELLALLGLAWPRILIYPGGLWALLLAWLWRRGVAANTQTHETPVARRLSRVSVLTTVPPLVAISLLPLPFAAQFSRPTDLIVTVALLEWPIMLRFAALPSERARQYSAQLALGYGVLLPALLALAQTTRSFGLDTLVAQSGTSEILPLLLRWGAVGGWALALVPLLALGPFHHETTGTLALALRAVGHILVATLPLLALTDSWWIAPLPPLVLSILLVAVQRWPNAATEQWEKALHGGAIVLWALLAWAAAAALLSRAT